jgi:hypothetical protein
VQSADHQTVTQRGMAAMHTADGFISLVGGAALLAGEARQACLDFCEQNRGLVLACLPDSLSAVVLATGFATMLQLVTAYGGRRLYLPTRPDKFHTQTGLSIPSVHYELWREHADVNGQIDIPSTWGLFLALRRAAIRLALARDWPPEALHTTFGISRKQLKAYREEEVASMAAQASVA